MGGGRAMLLPLEEVDQFFRLHRSLMFFVNRRLEVIDKKIATPEAYSGLPPETRIEVHKAFLEHLDLIDAFAAENPFRLRRGGSGDRPVVEAPRVGHVLRLPPAPELHGLPDRQGAGRRLRRRRPVRPVRGRDRPVPAPDDQDDPPAVQGPDRLRRARLGVQRLLRRRDQAAPQRELQGGQGTVRHRHVAPASRRDAAPGQTKATARNGRRGPGKPAASPRPRRRFAGRTTRSWP